MNGENAYNDIDLMIVRFSADNNDVEALNALKAYTSLSEENREYVRQRLEILFSSEVASDTGNYDALRAYKRFQNAANMPAVLQQNGRARSLFKYIVRVAAVVLIILLPFIGFHAGIRQVKNKFADITVHTPKGAPVVICLPDSTKVWLAGASSLVYSQSFGVDNRDVSLQGEACFDVRHNDDLPFRINTSDIRLQVLGTKFTIRDYSEDSTATVDLLRGKVLLEGVATGDSVYLSPNERMTLQKSTGIMSIARMDLSHSDTWIHNELFFDEIPLSEIAKALSRRYDVEIEVAPHLGDKPFYGQFNASQSNINDILKMMSLTNQMRYKYKDGKYIIY